MLCYNVVCLFNFFVNNVKARMRADTQNVQQGEQEIRGVGERRTKQCGTETLGDLWKREGWGGVHWVNKMDATGTFRSLHDRDLSGKKAENLKEEVFGWISGCRKDRGFGWGKIRDGAEQLC